MDFIDRPVGLVISYANTRWDMIFEKIPILVVDDELANRRFANVWLRQYGFEAIEAEDALRAAGALQAIPGLRLVVTDFQLKSGSARTLHREVRGVIAERRGLFCVVTNAEMNDPALIDPRNAPHAEYFREEGVTVFRKPADWGGVIIPHLQAWLEAQRAAS